MEVLSSTREEPAAPEPGPTVAARDIRSGTPYLLAPSTLKGLARRTASTVALIAIDVAGLTGTLYLALALRESYRGAPLDWGSLWSQAAEWLPFLVLVTVLVFWQGGLYRPRERRSGFGRLLGSFVLVGLLTLAFAIGTGFEFRTYGLVPTTIVLAAAFIGLLRKGYDDATRLVLRHAGVRRRVLLVGTGHNVGHVRHALGSARAGIRYEFVGVVSPAHQSLGLPLLGLLPDLPRVLATHPIDELIVADAEIDRDKLLSVVDVAHRRGVRVRIAPRTTGLLATRAEYIPGQGMPLFELRPPVLGAADWAAKRVFDVVVSLAIVILGFPLWLAVAAAVKLTSRGPVLYRDRRVGLGEQEFLMLKFRTMENGAAARRVELAGANQASGALFKIHDDPRITRVGRLLRRVSIDEIPQVLNVLRGEMSLVGPRPLPTADYEQLQEHHRKRSFVLPGMTGLWQISGRSDLGADDLVLLDFYYLERWSIWLDVTIMLKTIPAVLAGRGAY